MLRSDRDDVNKSFFRYRDLECFLKLNKSNKNK